MWVLDQYMIKEMYEEDSTVIIFQEKKKNGRLYHQGMMYWRTNNPLHVVSAGICPYHWNAGS